MDDDVDVMLPNFIIDDDVDPMKNEDQSPKDEDDHQSDTSKTSNDDCNCYHSKTFNDDCNCYHDDQSDISKTSNDDCNCCHDHQSHTRKTSNDDCNCCHDHQSDTSTTSNDDCNCYHDDWSDGCNTEYESDGWDSEVSYGSSGQNQNKIFQQSYLCYPLSHIQRSHLEGVNRVIMPQSALDRLSSLEIEYPMVFEIRSHFYEEPEPISHCGVLEFTAEEGFVFVPNWMMNNLQLEPGELVKLKSIELPKGNYMKIQPHKTEFIRLKDPKEVLETALKNFACLTAGETMMITYDEKPSFFDVLETKPKNAISVVETDCVVDFAEPLDYEFEQEKRRKANAALVDGGIQGSKETKEIASEKETKFTAFSGAGRRLDGKAISSDESNHGTEVCHRVPEGEVKTESDSRVEGMNFKPFQGKKNLLTD